MPAVTLGPGKQAGSGKECAPNGFNRCTCTHPIAVIGRQWITLLLYLWEQCASPRAHLSRSRATTAGSALAMASASRQSSGEASALTPSTCMARSNTCVWYWYRRSSTVLGVGTRSRTGVGATALCGASRPPPYLHPAGCHPTTARRTHLVPADHHLGRRLAPRLPT